MNGDLRVAYRASPNGERDIVFVPNWFTCCEHLPELPPLQGWVQAMTSLGRVIFFDQPGSGASDPVEPREAVLLTGPGALAPGALFAATHPARTTALVVLEGYANPIAERNDGVNPDEVRAGLPAMERGDQRRGGAT